MTTAATQATDDAAARVPVEIEGGEAVAKALENVRGIVADITTMVDTSKAAEPAAAEPDAAPAASAVPTVKSILEGAGLSGEELAAATEKLTANGVDVEKALDEASAPAVAEEISSEAEAETPLTVEGLGAVIQKAAAFTPARIAQLQSMQETLKLMMDAIAPGTSPSTKAPTVERHANPNTTVAATGGTHQPKPVDVSKSAAQTEVVDTLKALATGIEGLAGRLDKIEGTRQGSNDATETDETTDTNVQKSGSLWAGVL